MSSLRSYSTEQLIALRKRKLLEASPQSSNDPDLEWARSYAGRPIEFLCEISPKWAGPDWAAWRAFVKVLFGVSLTAAEHETYATCTELAEECGPYREAWLPIGRRGGKSETLAMIAVYLAVCFDWTRYLAAGQFGYVSVLSDSKAHAGEIMNYVKGLLGHPRLNSLTNRDLAETVEVKGQVRIQVVTASIKAVRARTVIAALCVAEGTLVETKSGPWPIEVVRAGDMVWTRTGLRSVIAAGMTSPSAEVRRVKFSNGCDLVATPDHPVFVRQKGFIAVSSLRNGDEVLVWDRSALTAAPGSIGEASAASRAPLSCANESSGSGSLPPTGFGLSSGAASGGTCRKTATIGTGRDSCFTARFTWRNTVRSLRVTTSWFTTKTTIRRIFRSITCAVSRYLSASSSMAFAVLPLGVPVTSGIRREFLLCGRTESRSRASVPSAEILSSRSGCARSTVVLRVEVVPERVSVYNLKVADTPEYFVNGVLTHNCDEIAFWESSEEAANPDVEILRGLRPAMATIPNAIFLGASSRYARRGALWEAYRDHYGKPGGSLVWAADTVTMHPSIDRGFIAAEYAKDPTAAAAEYGLEWRSDVAEFIQRERVEALVVAGRYELPYVPGTRYHAFFDAAGGSGEDSMTLGIAHRDPRTTNGVLDLLRERRPPFDPETVVEEFAADVKAYRVQAVHGDRYAGDWPGSQFRKRGVGYRANEKTASDFYREALPLLNGGKVELLDDKRFIGQVCNLERKVSRLGKDTISHPPRQHDDLANVGLGALVLAAGSRGVTFFSSEAVDKLAALSAAGRA